MENYSEIVTRGILKQELSRIVTLSLENKEKISKVEIKLEKLDKIDNVLTVLDKMTNDFHNYREQQEIASQHLKEYWDHNQTQDSLIEDHNDLTPPFSPV